MLSESVGLAEKWIYHINDSYFASAKNDIQLVQFTGIS